MAGKCTTHWTLGLVCPAEWGPARDPACSSLVTSRSASPSSIDFGNAPHPRLLPEKGTPIPGYDAPALSLKPVRDPALSLIASGGIEPRGPVMVEVPLVQNNSTLTAAKVLAGKRVGFADRYDLGSIEHRACFIRALNVLRQAGAHLVPVFARSLDETLQFNLHARNEIDDLLNEHQLDALVSDSRSAAFHSACWHGYPRLGEPLGDGTTLWFYGARWSKDALAALVQGYRVTCRLTHAGHGL